MEIELITLDSLWEGRLLLPYVDGQPKAASRFSFANGRTTMLVRCTPSDYKRGKRYKYRILRHQATKNKLEPGCVNLHKPIMYVENITKEAVGEVHYLRQYHAIIQDFCTYMVPYTFIIGHYQAVKEEL